MNNLPLVRDWWILKIMKAECDIKKKEHNLQRTRKKERPIELSNYLTKLNIETAEPLATLYMKPDILILAVVFEESLKKAANVF